MNAAKLKAIAVSMESDLSARGVKPKKNPEASHHTTKLEHVAWMCIKVQEMDGRSQLGKMMRWLGFAQGVLWAEGITTIAAAKKANSLS